ncbi:hypothetical protein L5515_017454 [Caenorhabditis briggsae]|uniref:Uncharacterized protein n=1 Tax=Caenorhabditis briggsae TaxID=6238 RepID=A0AAE9JRJ8_CAEBR|nr:hypothetical protein L5515_017454 [Caenorhabditis briggsae]
MNDRDIIILETKISPVPYSKVILKHFGAIQLAPHLPLLLIPPPPLRASSSPLRSSSPPNPTLWTPRMPSALMLLIFFATIIVVTAHVHFDRESEYDNFMRIIADQNQKDEKERLRKYIFKPNKPDPRYHSDRHGRHFITCYSFNTTLNEKGINRRCYRRSANLHAVCHFTVDYSGQNYAQDCFDMPVESDDVCTEKCNVVRKVTPYEGNPGLFKAVGHCCCTTDNCNRDEKTILKEELQRRGKWPINWADYTTHAPSLALKEIQAQSDAIADAEAEIAAEPESRSNFMSSFNFL